MNWPIQPPSTVACELFEQARCARVTIERTGYELQTSLCVSTSHFPASVRMGFEPDINYCIAVTAYGAIFYVPSPDESEEDPFEACPDLPRSLRDALTLARALRCTHMHVDSDGPLLAEDLIDFGEADEDPRDAD
jgi:hypothetical protein